jgi:hypothetical protein
MIKIWEEKFLNSCATDSDSDLNMSAPAGGFFMDGPVKSFPQPIFSMRQTATMAALGVNAQTAGFNSFDF